MKRSAAIFLLCGVAVLLGCRRSPSLQNRSLEVSIGPADGTLKLRDKATGAEWTAGAPQLVLKDKRIITVKPREVMSRENAIEFAAEDGTKFRLQLVADPPGLEYSCEPGPDVEEAHLLHDALPLGPGEDNYYAVPHRLGILLPVEGDKPWSRKIPAYQTGGGYSMAMFGAVKNGSALLLSWNDPYTDILVDFAAAPQKKLTMALALRRSARSVRMYPVGRGGYVDIGKAYRQVARKRGYLKTLDEKVRENPRVAEFFGAADFKPFAYMRLVPNTRWNKSHQTVYQKNFTFDECARLAEHYKNDLGIDRALLVLNGWIKGGYDNYHPDILPAAPAIGGNAGLRDCARRVKALGWTFGLHDNYQDFYKDAPSWNEEYLIKNSDGSPRLGGVWAGGQCWLICSKKSLDLAKRPQNIPQVKAMVGPAVYFSDTVFAAGLYECHDPKHPETMIDDIEHKQRLCDYLRGEFGLFGSEEGREWGVPHADYFEGLMSHKTGWNRGNKSDIVIPLFEVVYGDAIPLYTHQSDRPEPDNPTYILDHILYAEMPVYFFGKHVYWTDSKQDFQPPAGAEARMVFAQGGRFNRIDQFIKNTYEVLSPLHRVTALMQMTDHRFLTVDRKVEFTRFGKDVEIIVNYGEADYNARNAVLPQYGFLVESPNLVAYYARNHGGEKFAEPSLAVFRSLDGKPLASSAKVKLYRGFGDKSLSFRGGKVEVDNEKIVEPAQ
jgi:uncharacterized protein DUF5696